MVKFLSLATLCAGAALANAQVDQANTFVPLTSMVHAWDVGFAAHTNHLIYIGAELFPSQEYPLLADMLTDHGPALGASGPAGFHPTDLQSAYGDHSTGAGVIAIVDAYHFPTSLHDFNSFSAQFGLKQEPSTTATASTNKVFQVVYAKGSQPATNGGWSQEMALDIEWAHAMAPGAKIVLVEAASSSFTDLFGAVQTASGLPGVTQVSMSWGGAEFGSETQYDSKMVKPGVTFFASSGDSGGVREYPAASPSVVSVGGTSLSFSGTTRLEVAWSGSGGGASTVESRPSFQSTIASIVGAKRGIPDISADANPNTGVSVYDSTAYQGFVGWFVVGGTSVACPVCAGIANAGGAKRGSNELAWIYANHGGFNDIKSGSAGANHSVAGWDFVTGWGTPHAASSL
jgi:hypothetical protein